MLLGDLKFRGDLQAKKLPLLLANSSFGVFQSETSRCFLGRIYFDSGRHFKRIGKKLPKSS